jgi:glycosyltransferase involved in cell wall biosynthesis
MWINETARDCGCDATAGPPGGPLPLGVNVVGHLKSEKGVGEMVRSNLRVLEAARIPFVANDFVDPGSENVEECSTPTSSSNPYRVNLISVNADVLSYFVKSNPGYMRRRFNVGYWAWELSEFPQEWASSFGYLDEVWTLSSFARDSIGTSSRVPVHVIHCSLDLGAAPASGWSRASFGIPEEAFVFLFMFDLHSFIDRKNPFGLIQTFKAAFEGRKDVLLVVKCSHGGHYPLEMKALREAAVGQNIYLIDQVYPRDAKNGLINVANCYVSLHRSEGFGLTLAEAMFYGKPVIATGYSGNTDFMSSENSFLVPYRSIPIERTHGPYRAGMLWADPDLDYAAEVLRYVEGYREAAAKVGIVGRDHVSTTLHPATIGKSVALRLQELGLMDSWYPDCRESSPTSPSL